MTGPIQIGGLASGLDSASIIQALVQAQGVPIQLLESQRQTQEQKISLLGTFDGYLSTLRDQAEELSESTGFLANTVSLDIEGFASFDVSGSTSLGTYSLDIQQLASSDRYSFTEVADPNEDLAVDTGLLVSFAYDGESYELSFDPGEGSLNEISDRIQEETGGAVQASVIQTGTDADPGFALVIEGSGTGESFAIEGLEVVSEGGLLSVDEQLTVASNAVVEFNGLTLERETNQFDDVVPGLSFSAESVTDGPIEFSVSVDDDSVIEELTEFVDAFNQAIGFINQQGTFTEEGGTGGALFGDSALRSVQNSLRDSLFGLSGQGQNSSFSSLGGVGIDLQADGTLSLNESEVRERLAEDPDAFSDLFVDNDGFDNGDAEEGTAAFYQDITADSGLFSQIVQGLEILLDGQTLSNGETVSGLLDSRRDTIQSDIDRMNERIESLEFRLEAFETQLVQQYANLESLLSGIQAQGSALSSLQNSGLQNNN